MKSKVLVIYLNDKDCNDMVVGSIVSQLESFKLYDIDIIFMIPARFYNTIKIALIEAKSDILVKVYTSELDYSNMKQVAKYLIYATKQVKYEYLFMVNVDVILQDDMTDILLKKSHSFNPSQLVAAVTTTGTFFGGKYAQILDSLDEKTKERTIKYYKPKALSSDNLNSYINQLKIKNEK